MALLVQKFGGTSVGDLERIQHVASKVAATRAQGHDVVVVVSAMSGETDRLIKLAKAIHQEPHPREYAMLVTTGEQVAVALLAMALQAKGCEARSYTGSQAGIQTSDDHQKARITAVHCQLLKENLTNGLVPVVAGFQGMSQVGDITTLGRGGSDTTAVALAAALGADECQIYTDVDGVYTTDPRIVPEAKRIDRITFEEMFEMSSLGAKVLQVRSVEFAGKYQVPLRVLSTFEEGPGTLITFERPGELLPKVSGIAVNRNEAKLSVIGVPDMPGVAASILGPIGRAGIEIDMIVQNVGVNGLIDFTFTVQRDDYQRALTLLDEISQRLSIRKIISDNKIAKLSLVGAGMRTHANVASIMFKALGEQNINIQLISTSEIKISVVVSEECLDAGVKALHSVFQLNGAVSEES